jgi:hypothetical protein
MFSLVRKEVLYSEDIIEMLPQFVQEIAYDLHFKDACGMPPKRLRDLKNLDLETAQAARILSLKYTSSKKLKGEESQTVAQGQPKLRLQE